MKGATLHGTFAAGDDGTVKWLPAGGLAPVTPSRANPYEIERHFPEDVAAAGAPALFYTRMGDVLPGNMHALDRDGVEFDSGITQLTKLPAGSWRRLSWGIREHEAGWADGRRLAGAAGAGRGGAAGRELDRDGPRDSDWERGGDAMPGDSIPVENRVGPRGGAAAAVLRRDGYVEAVEQFPVREQRMQLMCGREATEGQFDMPQINANAANGEVQVRLVILADRVDMYLNGCA